MNDDTLILFYYGDGLSDVARAAVETAIANDAAVRERYLALSQWLDGVGEPPASAPSAELTERWHCSITRAAADERADAGRVRPSWHLPSFAWGALAAVLVAGIAMGLYIALRPVPGPSVAAAPDLPPERNAPVDVPGPFHRGLTAHLRQTRRDIARLASDAEPQREALILDIVRTNRRFERNAHEHQADDVARVLRAFEPILVQLASQDVSAADSAALQAKLEFELDVVLTKLRRHDSQQWDSI